MIHRIRFSHGSAGLSIDLEFDLVVGVIRRDRREIALPAALVTELRALADQVEQGHEALQPSHLTYAQSEFLEILGDGPRIFIDAHNGEIKVGPPGELIQRLLDASHPDGPR